jgi:hypothetical protein
MYSYLLLFILLADSSSLAENLLFQPISPEELLTVQENAKFLDFRTDEARDLDGYIFGSQLLTENLDQESENTIRYKI